MIPVPTWGLKCLFLPIKYAVVLQVGQTADHGLWPIKNLIRNCLDISSDAFPVFLMIDSVPSRLSAVVFVLGRTACFLLHIVLPNILVSLINKSWRHFYAASISRPLKSIAALRFILSQLYTKDFTGASLSRFASIYISLTLRPALESPTATLTL